MIVGREENYNILLTLLATAKDKYLPTKVVKFNRKNIKCLSR